MNTLLPKLQPTKIHDLSGRADFNELFPGQSVPMPALYGAETILLRSSMPAVQCSSGTPQVKGAADRYGWGPGSPSNQTVHEQFN